MKLLWQREEKGTTITKDYTQQKQDSKVLWATKIHKKDTTFSPTVSSRGAVTYGVVLYPKATGRAFPTSH